MGASFQKMTHHIWLHGSSWHTNLEKYLQLCPYGLLNHDFVVHGSPLTKQSLMFMIRRKGPSEHNHEIWLGFFRVRGRHPAPVKRGKMHDTGHIWGKFSVNVVLHHFILCDPHYWSPSRSRQPLFNTVKRYSWRG